MRVAEIGLKGDFSNSKGMGIQRYMYELYKNLKNRNDIKAKKVELDFLGIRNSISFGLSSMFKDYGNYDIIHNLDLKPFFPIKKGNAIVISTAHDFYNLLAPELNGHLTNNLKGLIWLKVSFKYAIKSLFSSDHIIAVSELVKNDAVKLGYDKNRISVVNLGVDKRFRYEKLGQNKKPGTFIVGYIGSFASNKNVAFSIRAFNLITDPNIKFNIYGKQTYEYNNLVNLPSKNSHIYFKGRVPEKDLVKTYDTFNVFVYPSLYDGFGIPIIEAQARGIPVIVYKRGKISNEVKRYCIEVKDEEDMVLKIQKLKENGYSEKSKKKAMKYARSFTWEKTADKTVKVYLKYKK